MVATFINVIRKWLDDRRAIEALARLSDNQLNDIGLNRGNLEQAVRRGLWA